MAFEYLFAALPSLPRTPGESVALPASRLAAICAEEGGAAQALSSHLLLFFDIRAKELLAYGHTPSETAIASVDKLRDEEGIPEWFGRALKHGSSRYAFDAVWKAYYEELLSLAHIHRSRFLRRWVPWDAGLAEALARHRAKRLGVEADPAFIAWQGEGDPFDYGPAVDMLISEEQRGFNAWREMDRGIAALRIERALALAAEYSFDLDELMSYVVRFIALKECTFLS